MDRLSQLETEEDEDEDAEDDDDSDIPAVIDSELQNFARKQLRIVRSLSERILELKIREFGLEYRIPFREFIHELAGLLRFGEASPSFHPTISHLYPPS